MRGLALTILRGRFAGHAVPLGATPVVLGRQGATVFLESPHASARHAELRIEGQAAVLRDLGSAVGTRVNGSPVATRVVSVGDVIEIAGDAFRIDWAGPAPRALLIATRGPLLGHSFPVVAAPVVIGRDADCTIVIASARASRRHCEVRPEATGLFLHDLASGNGTWVNGERIRVRELSPGDLIEVGDEQLRIDAPMASLPTGPHATAAPQSPVAPVGPYAETAVAPPVAAYAPPPPPAVTTNRVATVAPGAPGTPPAAATTLPRSKSPLASSLPGPMATTVRCPRCGRAVDPRLQDCPWDGAALINGKTFF